jgi:transposase
VESNFQLDDTGQGHQALKKILQRLFARHSATTLYAGLESTGGYENNWYQMLLNLSASLNINVCRLNPVGVNHHKKADLKRNSTDKISARSIAEYLIHYSKTIIYNRVDSKVALKKEWKFIKMLTKQNVQLKNQFESAVYTTHPQLLKYWKDNLPNWLLLLVKQYPTAVKLARARENTVAKIPYVSLERAKELIKDAGESIGAEQDEVTECRVKSLAQQILRLQQLIKEQIEMMIRFCPFNEIEILTSFVGIAEFSAVGLMLVIDNIQRFNSCDKLCSYVGVHPVYKNSGDGSGGYRMSKKGSKEARWILFNVAQNACIHNEMIRALYEGYLAKGKVRMAAIGIIMHKIMRIIYGMLKNNTKYDPKLDEANRREHIDKRNETVLKPDKKRRYQTPDENAPISRRQQKKRNRLALALAESTQSEENKRERIKTDMTHDKETIYSHSYISEEDKQRC